MKLDKRASAPLAGVLSATLSLTQPFACSDPCSGTRMARAGTTLVTADRWCPSSQMHHGCGCRLIAATRMAKTLFCAVTGEVVDRDVNVAALNLRDWPEPNSESWAFHVSQELHMCPSL